MRRDPTAFYDNPQAVVADDGLTVEQKRRFLEDWARELEDKQEGPGESAAAGSAVGELLDDIRRSIADLDAPAA